ncbi:sensor histidine kinase [Parvularcula lutaonensis]|uniref:Sensor histidine kinase n=1 Tax=Parvularcula lutaonensis TaxID=491923 RepID=A0ABV7MCE6_9PROT|nr:histidine kinase [Parvularcula lutaonensis]GGY37855.1 hypothetical protein GCM10007148_02660 [Parvularcula lutaonensis]
MTSIEQRTQMWLSSDNRRYWTLQIAGWLALTMLSYLSLTLWYNPGQWDYALHTLVQSVLGLIVSHPLRYVSRWAWNAPIFVRIAIVTAAVIAASVIWTALRLLTFGWLTGEWVSPVDYGGWLFASVIVFGSWVFCYHAAKYYRQSLEQKDRIAAVERAALQATARAHEESVKRLTAESLYQEARLRMLKYQLNPHFLFNALNSVSGLVRKGEAEGATSMLARIAEFLRATLEHDDELEHTLDQEIDLLGLYLSIEKIRFRDRLQTEFDVQPEAIKATVPSFLLQPLFENAMKYAVGRSLSPSTLTLAAWLDEGRLEIRVRDSGSDEERRQERNAPSSTGIGLRNVEQRLRSAFQDDFRLELVPLEPRGLEVQISVPAIGIDGRPLSPVAGTKRREPAPTA